jgi:hypothetical protein
MNARHLERADEITRPIDTAFNALLSAAAMDAEIDAGQTVDGILRRGLSGSLIGCSARLPPCATTS